MEEEQSRFRRLGFIDVTFGIRVTDREKLQGSKAYKLIFRTFACSEVKELTEGEETDFILEASYDAWKEMFQNIHANGQADRTHTINTLTHLGRPIKVLYDDPERRSSVRYLSDVSPMRTWMKRDTWRCSASEASAFLHVLGEGGVFSLFRHSEFISPTEGIDEHAGNGLQPYPGLRLRKRYVSSLK